MKKRFGLALAFALVIISLRSQTITYSADSLKKILCKTWEMEYAEMGSFRIDPKPGVNMLVLEFRSNNKVKVTGTQTDDKPEDWDWTFNVKEKYVSIIKDKKEKMRITNLEINKMIAKITATQNAPADLGDTKFILKPKE